MFAVKCKYHQTIQKKIERINITRKNAVKLAAEKSQTVCTSFIASRNHNMSIHPYTLASPRFLIADIITDSGNYILYRRWPMELLERQKSNQFYIDKHPSVFATVCRHPNDSTDTQVKNIIGDFHIGKFFLSRPTR